MDGKDITGSLFHKYRTLILILKQVIWTIINLSICRLKNIEVGKNNKFFGKTFFYRKPGSVIRVNNGCTFRSDKHSNLIGITHGCIISTHYRDAVIEIGKNCGLSGTTIGCAKKIIIKDNVLCGANTLITDFDWHTEDPRSSSPKEILIEENVWLGVNSVVLKGVTIGKNTIIGANSVVTKSIPDNVIAAGNPCKPIKVFDPNIISDLNES